MFSAAVLLGGSIGVLGAPPVRADPSAPAEIKFLNDVHANMQRYGETRLEGRSDANLVGEGWWACHELSVGSSPQQQGIDPLIAHYAVVDLCPNGCPDGCRHQQPWAVRR